MRIGLDARVTYYTRGGISAYARNLAAALPALDAPDDYIIFHARKARESLLQPEPTNARRADCWTPAHHRFERVAFGLELLPHRLDLLHSPDFIPPFGTFKSIITVHDLTFLLYPQFLTADSRRYYNDQIRFAVRRADAILADSDATQADIIALLGVPPRKITTVHLAPDANFHPLPVDQVDAVLNRLNLPKNYLLFVGTLEPRKNIPGLIRAYTLLPPDAPPLVIAGNKGWLFDDVHKIVRDRNLTSRVILLQDFSTADLPALYQGASVLILPSHYEGFGLPVLEAFACGAPVVISDRASLPEIAGDAAALCDPDDPASIAHAIGRVLDDSDFRKTLIARGRERVKDFSWEKCAKETLAVYQKTLNDER